jgi:hypothetical protein
VLSNCVAKGFVIGLFLFFIALLLMIIFSWTVVITQAKCQQEQPLLTFMPLIVNNPPVISCIRNDECLPRHSYCPPEMEKAMGGC